jgi:Protein of unknown function (DUF1573)
MTHLIKLFRSSTFVAALLVSVPLASAQLVWENKEVHIKAAPMEKEVVARYPFKNEGKEVVKFKDFRSACGCVSITTSTMVVPPGESGEVTVKFVPEHRLGDQKRPIAVQFDDEKQSRIALYLRVEIPEIIRPQPIFLRWGAEETLEPKSVTIVTDENYPVESMKVRSVHPLWDARVTPIANSRNYTLQITPKRGQGPQSRHVELEALLANGHIKRTNLYVVVR